MDRNDTGPPKGFVRVTSHVLVGEDGTWVVMENDQSDIRFEHGDIRAQWDAWMSKAKRVDFSVDVPLPLTVTCKGKVL